jgi:hypothetical protein
MKVKIFKNKRVLDSNDQFTYVLEFYLKEELIHKVQVKLNANEYMLPDEDSYAIVPILEQLKFSHEFDIDKVVYEDIII